MEQQLVQQLPSTGVGSKLPHLAECVYLGGCMATLHCSSCTAVLLGLEHAPLTHMQPATDAMLVTLSFVCCLQTTMPPHPSTQR